MICGIHADMCERIKAFIATIAKFAERPEPRVSPSNKLVNSFINGIDDLPPRGTQRVSPTNILVHTDSLEFPWSKRLIHPSDAPAESMPTDKT